MDYLDDNDGYSKFELNAIIDSDFKNFLKMKAMLPIFLDFWLKHSPKLPSIIKLSKKCLNIAYSSIFMEQHISLLDFLYLGKKAPSETPRIENRECFIQYNKNLHFNFFWR